MNWFTKFPEYQANDLYISGESYGGIYVPYLAYAVDQYNTKHATDGVFLPNLKGFMVGNGVTNWDYDCTPAFIEMGYWHSLYDTALYDEMKAKNCKFTGPFYYDTTPECVTLAEEFEAGVSDVDVYDIFGICYGPYPNPQL